MQNIYPLFEGIDNNDILQGPYPMY